MTQRQRSLIGGISVLGAAGLICKVVGVLYRIPLTNMIGDLGMGLYGQVMPSYNLLLSITSAGIALFTDGDVMGNHTGYGNGNTRGGYAQHEVV